MKLIIGLGNPGEKYVNARHNLGFWVLEELGKKMDGGRWKIGAEDRRWKLDKKFKSQILRPSTTLRTQNDNLMLVKPQTYVNRSGMAVKLLTTYYQLPATDVIVVYDELDLPLGKIKVRMSGASAGHHGVESIIDALGTDKFVRVRLGIGPAKGTAEQFVLNPFTPSEKAQVKHMIKQAIKELDLLCNLGHFG